MRGVFRRRNERWSGMRRLRAGFVPPLPGGPGNRPGGNTTPPRGARWTGTGRKASSQEARTRGLCLRPRPRARSRSRSAGKRASQPERRYASPACRAASPAAQEVSQASAFSGAPLPSPKGECRGGSRGVPGAGQTIRALRRARFTLLWRGRVRGNASRFTLTNNRIYCLAPADTAPTHRNRTRSSRRLSA